MAKIGGGVLGVFLVCVAILLLTRGHPKPEPRPKGPPKPVLAGPSAGVQDAFAFAKDLESRLRAEPRYARVYLVPSAATANQKMGKVVVMGDVASDEDLRLLQSTVARGGIPITLEWQVSVEQSGPTGPPP